MQPNHHTTQYLLAGRFYTLAQARWGDPALPPVVCVHGLSRNSRDFDALAQALTANYYVICPDLPGRGQSEWLAEPALYNPLSYVVALGHLLAEIGQPVRYVGTSLGGICGMLLAAAPGTPILRMVLNDIGPFLPKAALARIADYVGHIPEFDDLAGLEAHLRRVHATFGPLSDAQWAHLARHSARTGANGRLTLHFDPAMTIPLRATEPADVDMWPVWNAIAVPMLAIRGVHSDLLLADTLSQMAGKSQTEIVPDTGHAPALMDQPTIAVIQAFLAGKGG